jgi:hypothetical protein
VDAGPPSTPARATSTTSVVGDSSEGFRVNGGERLAGGAIGDLHRRDDDERLAVPLRSRRLDLFAAPHRHGVPSLGAVERVGERQRRLQIVPAEEGVLDPQLIDLSAGDRRRAVDVQIGDAIGALIPALQHQAAVVHAMVVVEVREERVGDVDRPMAALQQAVMRTRSVVPDDQVVADFDEIAGALSCERRRWRAGAEQGDAERLRRRRRRGRLTIRIGVGY